MVPSTYYCKRAAFPKSNSKKDITSLLAGLKLCSKTRDFDNGKRLHKDAIDSGSLSNTFVATALVDLYSKCGIMVEAREVFDGMAGRDVVAWNALLLGYVENGESHVALELLPTMRKEGCLPNSRTFLATAIACGNLASKETGKPIDGKLVKVNSLRQGMAFHSQIDATDCKKNTILATALISMYSKTGSMQYAWNVFKELVQKDVGSWNALLSGYVDNGQGFQALELFTRMRREGWDPNARTFTAALVACTKLSEEEEGVIINSKHVKVRCLEKGMELHLLALKSGLAADLYVGNNLLEMYSRCGSMEDAQRVFGTLLYPSVVSYTIMMQGYTEDGKSRVALQIFDVLKSAGVSPDARTYVAALNACSGLAAREEGNVELDLLEAGGEMYREAVKTGYGEDVFVAAAAIDMFAKCGNLMEAQNVFDKLEYRDSVTWNSLLLGYVENGEAEHALQLFELMRQQSFPPTARTYLAVIKAYSLKATAAEEQERCLENGTALHAEAVSRGFHHDIYVTQAVLDLYMKSGCFVRGQNLFDSLLKKDAACWTTLVLGYAENGEDELVFESFQHMIRAGFDPEARVYVAALTACGVLAAKGNDKEKWLGEGRALHSGAEAGGFLSDMFVATAVVSMYSKCGSVDEARKVFDSMQSHDVVSWNSLLLGYVENGEDKLALDLLRCMEAQGCDGNSRTFSLALSSCAAMAANEEERLVDGMMIKLQSLDVGMSLHSKLALTCEFDASVGCMLVEMYARVGSLVDARKVFDTVPFYNVSSWASLVVAYAEKGEAGLALELFDALGSFSELFPPTPRAFTAALKACATSVELGRARKIHSQICRTDVCGLERSLVEAYGKCGSLPVAQHVSDCVSSRELGCWNALMVAYSQHGDALEVLRLFRTMQEDGCMVDDTTLSSALSACSRAGLVEEGRKCFEALKKLKYHVEPKIEHYHCMVDMLGRANLLDEALTVIKDMPFDANAITWMTLLSACCKWKNVKIGRMVFESLVRIDEANHAAYVLMANLNQISQ